MKFKIAGKENLINLGNEDARTVDAGVRPRQEEGSAPGKRAHAKEEVVLRCSRSNRRGHAKGRGGYVNEKGVPPRWRKWR
jgi:hypothetical protein